MSDPACGAPLTRVACDGARGGTRTPDARLRTATLYPLSYTGMSAASCLSACYHTGCQATGVVEVAPACRIPMVYVRTWIRSWTRLLLCATTLSGRLDTSGEAVNVATVILSLRWIPGWSAIHFSRKATRLSSKKTRGLRRFERLSSVITARLREGSAREGRRQDGLTRHSLVGTVGAW
jgi:hypothetical protein